MAFVRGKQVLMSVYLRPEVHTALKVLAAETGIPVSRLLRDAADKVLEEHGVKVPKRRIKK